MPHGHHPGDVPESPADLIRRLTAEISGGPSYAADPADLAAWDTRTVLRRLGGLMDDPHRYGAGSPNEDGVGFARAAVSTWPDADTLR